MSLEHSPIRPRGIGRPRRQDAASPPQPQVFLTRDQLAARWHCTSQTISRRARKLGLVPTMIMGRWLIALTQVEAIERKQTVVDGGDQT